MTDRVAIWGASGHALVVADIVRQAGRREIAGYLDDVNLGRSGERFGGARVLGGGEQLASLRDDGVESVIVAVGDCAARLRLADLVRAHGLELVSAIHPRATVAPDVAIGAGTVICAGAVVNPGSTLGACVIVNTAASIDHECALDDGVAVGPGARLGGRVRVGRAAWIGIGATVSDRITIGAGSVIGAGAVVVRDVPDGVVAFGVPATVRRTV